MGSVEEHLLNIILPRLAELPDEDHLVYYEHDQAEYNWRKDTSQVDEEEEGEEDVVEEEEGKEKEAKGEKEEEGEGKEKETEKEHKKRKRIKPFFNDSLLCYLLRYIFETEEKNLQDLQITSPKKEEEPAAAEQGTTTTTSTASTKERRYVLIWIPIAIVRV